MFHASGLRDVRQFGVGTLGHLQDSTGASGYQQIQRKGRVARMGRTQRWVYHSEPSHFPEDFTERLESFRKAAGLSSRGLARRLRVSARSVWRWNAGTKPDPGHLFALFSLAAEMGLLHHLLPVLARPESDDGNAARTTWVVETTGSEETLQGRPSRSFAKYS